MVSHFLFQAMVVVRLPEKGSRFVPSCDGGINWLSGTLQPVESQIPAISYKSDDPDEVGCDGAGKRVGAQID